MSHADLIARLEALTGPDRETDVWIAVGLGLPQLRHDYHGFAGNYLERVAGIWSAFGKWTCDGCGACGGCGAEYHDHGALRIPEYTASLDAAVALVERLKHLHGRKIICTFNAGAQIMGNDADYDPRSLPDNSQTVGWMAHVAFYKPGSSETYGPDGYTHAATPAIALLIATLKALEQQND